MRWHARLVYVLHARARRVSTRRVSGSCRGPTASLMVPAVLITDQMPAVAAATSAETDAFTHSLQGLLEASARVCALEVPPVAAAAAVRCPLRTRVEESAEVASAEGRGGGAAAAANAPPLAAGLPRAREPAGETRAADDRGRPQRPRGCARASPATHERTTTGSPARATKKRKLEEAAASAAAVPKAKSRSGRRRPKVEEAAASPAAVPKAKSRSGRRRPKVEEAAASLTAVPKATSRRSCVRATAVALGCARCRFSKNGCKECRFGCWRCHHRWTGCNVCAGHFAQLPRKKRRQQLMRAQAAEAKVWKEKWQRGRGRKNGSEVWQLGRAAPGAAWPRRNLP